MLMALTDSQVAKGSEAAFEQIWMSRDSHLNKVPALYRFTFSKAPRLRITPFMLRTPCGEPGCIRGMDQTRGVPGSA
jgi:hypothetical protein